METKDRKSDDGFGLKAFIASDYSSVHAKGSGPGLSKDGMYVLDFVAGCFRRTHAH